MQHSLILQNRSFGYTQRSWGAVFAKGFRPFFLLAALYAVAMVPLWLLIVGGTVAPRTYLDPVSWHAHEMLFGFVAAVLAGFLLTAVGNWTKRETAVGLPLVLLTLLWLAGRAAMLLGSGWPRGLVAAVDLAFLPALAFALGRPLLAAKERRNLVMLAIVGALFLTNVAVHLDALGVLPPASARSAVRVGLDLITLVMLIIAGRVFPMFTRNATQASDVRSIPWLDATCVGGMALLTAVDVEAAPSFATASLAGAVGVAAAARAIGWGARRSVRQPLLWILHVGYGWIVIGLLLRAASGWGWPHLATLATHALTVGAIGCLTLGMMARVSLGHTGRMLAAPAPLAAVFVAINIAALVRVIGPLLVPTRYFEVLVAATAFWSVSFAAFLATYARALTSPRVDGRPG